MAHLPRGATSSPPTATSRCGCAPPSPAGCGSKRRGGGSASLHSRPAAREAAPRFRRQHGPPPAPRLELVVQRPPGEPLTVERWSLADGTVSPVPFRRLVDPELGEAVAFTLDFAPGESHLVTVGASAGSGSPGEGSAPRPARGREARRCACCPAPPRRAGTSRRDRPPGASSRGVADRTARPEPPAPRPLLLQCRRQVEGCVVPLRGETGALRGRYDVAPFAFRDVQP